MKVANIKFSVALAVAGGVLNAGAAEAQFERAALAAAPVPLEARPDGEWRALLGAGFAGSAGNTRSLNLNLLADAVRVTPTTRWSLSAHALYGKGEVGGELRKTADQWRLGARHDWRRSAEGVYVFASGNAERDALRNLDLRSAAGVGVGYRDQWGPDNSGEVFGGLGVRNDSYGAPGNLVRGELLRHYRIAELLVGEETQHRLSDNTSFQQRVMIYPNLDKRGEFRASFEAVLSVAMTRNVILTVSLSDRYDSQAAAPLKRNDVLLFTGVNLRLGPR